jgi:hypothetical protein
MGSRIASQIGSTLSSMTVLLRHMFTGENDQRSNQTMKPTAPLRENFSVFATDPTRGLSPSR